MTEIEKFVLEYGITEEDAVSEEECEDISQEVEI